jgi:ubiquitin-protein ligase
MAETGDPRQRRLNTERERLEKLNQESDYVRVQPIDVLPGSEPEKYRVTFLCRGIVGIDVRKNPLYAERHEVEIHCDEEFPADVPRLRWVTPIWHPNIQHQGAKGVCVNKAEWLGGMRLDDLCRLMFEMVQYRNYHATFTKPYPLDHEVAKWVTEFAEPRGIVDKRRGIFIDNKPFTRPTVPSRINLAESSVPPQPSRIRVQPVAGLTVPARIKLVAADPVAPAAATSRPRVTVVKKG